MYRKLVSVYCALGVISSTLSNYVNVCLPRSLWESYQIDPNDSRQGLRLIGSRYRRMRAYVSVHLPKLLVTFLAISFFVLVIWLDGYRNNLVIGYGLLLFGLFIVLVYLADYLSNTAFYHYIKHGRATHRSNGYLSRQWRKQFDAQEQHDRSILGYVLSRFFYFRWKSEEEVGRYLYNSGQKFHFLKGKVFLNHFS